MNRCRVNGQEVSLQAEATLDKLLQQLGLAGKRVAVECNGRVVPRSLFGRTPVADGDRIEIVRAVGGG